MEIASIIVLATLIIGGIFAAYNLLHYVLFLLAAHPKDAGRIGHELNEFERRQLVEWVPKAGDFLKHDDEHRTYDDVFGPYRDVLDNYSTCVFPRAVFTQAYASDYLLLQPRDGMRLLESGMRIGRGSGLSCQPVQGRHRVCDQFFRAGRHCRGNSRNSAVVSRSWSPTSTA